MDGGAIISNKFIVTNVQERVHLLGKADLLIIL